MQIQDYLVATRQPPTLEEVVARINEISTLPHIAVRVMDVANDPDSSVLDMKQVIETDPALSARILRCVNSSAYALREKVSSLQRAISFIGMRQVRNLALTATVADLFVKDETIDLYRRQGLWQHLVAVGICARMIAMRQGMPDFEDAFVAGLLHDIGIVLEDQYLHEPFRQVILDLRNNRTLVEAERNRLGFDHTRLGSRVAECWRFSERIKAAIGYHHASMNYRGEDVMIVRCVEVSNVICTLKGHTSVGRKLLTISQPTLNALSLSREHIAAISHDLDRELAKNSALFNI